MLFHWNLPWRRTPPAVTPSTKGVTSKLPSTVTTRLPCGGKTGEAATNAPVTCSCPGPPALELPDPATLELFPTTLELSDGRDVPEPTEDAEDVLPVTLLEVLLLSTALVPAELLFAALVAKEVPLAARLLLPGRDEPALEDPSMFDVAIPPLEEVEASSCTQRWVSGEQSQPSGQSSPDAHPLWAGQPIKGKRPSATTQLASQSGWRANMDVNMGHAGPVRHPTSRCDPSRVDGAPNALPLRSAQCSIRSTSALVPPTSILVRNSRTPSSPRANTARMNPSDIHWSAVMVAAVTTFLVGGAWYSPLLFGKAWQRLAGLSDVDLQGGTARVFGVSLVMALVQSTNLAFFIGKSGTLEFAMFAAAATGVGFVAPALVVTGLFERRSGALLAIDAGYHVVSLLLMGAILGAWR